jgi:hypothetical protein
LSSSEGALLFGYFIFCEQNKVTGSKGFETKSIRDDGAKRAFGVKPSVTTAFSVLQTVKTKKSSSASQSRNQK